MSKLIEIQFTLRGSTLQEVADDFVLKRIDADYIAKAIGINRIEVPCSIDFRLVEK